MSDSIVVEEPPHLPFLEQSANAEFRWRLGVRPLDLANWFEWGPDADRAIAVKPALNERHRSTVFAALDDVEPESGEVAAAVVEHLHTHHPDRPAELDGSLHPLDAAARLVPDDLVLLVRRDGRLVFGGGSVCFPNRWDLPSKLGRTMAEVHEPVAQLNDHLERPIDKFFERLRPERSFWRLGWGIIDTPAWYAPPNPETPGRDRAAPPESMFLRVERESLRRFPETQAILFGIRTYVTPLPVLARDQATARHLAERIATMPADVREYKGVEAAADVLVTALRNGFASSPPA